MRGEGREPWAFSILLGRFLQLGQGVEGLSSGRFERGNNGVVTRAL